MIYLLVGLIALGLAVRGHGSDPDQKGAITDLAGRPYGAVLVVALAVGVAAYALWQLAQVFTGPAGRRTARPNGCGAWPVRSSTPPCASAASRCSPVRGGPRARNRPGSPRKRCVTTTGGGRSVWPAW